MLTKTTTEFELMEDSDPDERSNLSCKTKVMYLLIQIPIYACSAYFRLGSFSLSCVFFGYWTIIPMLLLLVIYVSIAACQSIDKVGGTILVFSNMSVVSLF